MRRIVDLFLVSLVVATFAGTVGASPSDTPAQLILDDGSKITVPHSQLKYTAHNIWQTTTNDGIQVELKGEVHLDVLQEGKSVVTIVTNHMRILAPGNTAK